MEKRETLSKLKQGLLQDLLTGKVRVNVAGAVEERVAALEAGE